MAILFLIHSLQAKFRMLTHILNTAILCSSDQFVTRFCCAEGLAGTLWGVLMQILFRSLLRVCCYWKSISRITITDGIVKRMRIYSHVKNKTSVYELFVNQRHKPESISSFHSMLLPALDWSDVMTIGQHSCFVCGEILVSESLHKLAHVDVTYLRCQVITNIYTLCNSCTYI
jgi:hypothetical protein